MPDNKTINFDIAGARKAGATDADIAEYFKSNYSVDFDVAGARQSGATDEDILGYINSSYGQKKNSLASVPPTEGSQPEISTKDSSPLAEPPTPLGEKSGVSEPINLEVKPNTLSSDYAAKRAEKLVVEPFVQRQKQTEELKNIAVKKQDEVSKNYSELKKQEKIVNYAARQEEIKQLQQIEQQLTNMGRVTKPEDIKAFKALVAQRDALLQSQAKQQTAFDNAPQMDIKKPSDFESISDYVAYQNQIKNQFDDFDKKKKEFEEVAPNFTSTKVGDILSVAQNASAKQQQLVEKIRIDQKEAEESIKAAQALNKDKLQKLGFGDAFVEGMEQTTLSNTLADMYLSGDSEKLQKSLENIYSESLLFPKETTTMGQVGEVLGGQVKPLAVAIGASAVNPLLGVASGSGYYGRMGIGSGLMDGYTTARSQGKTPSEAFEIAQNQAKVSGGAGVVEGIAASIPFLGKPMSKIITTPFKKAVMTAMADNGVDAVVAGASQYVQNKNLSRLGLNVESDRGVLENMGAEMVFGLGMHAAFTAGAKAVDANTYKSIINGLAKLPLNNIQNTVDAAVSGGFLDAPNVQQPMKDIMESASVQKKLQGVDIPENKENEVIDIQKKIDDLEKQKETASPAIIPAIENKILQLSEELQLAAEIPLSSKERVELEKLNDIAKSDEKRLKPSEIERRNHLRKRETIQAKKEEAAKTEAQKIKEANEEISKKAIELESTITEPKTETDAIQERSTEEVLSRQREGVSQERGERSGMGQSDKGKEVAGEGEVQKVKPIKQLGTGANVYFETKKYRVNEDSNGGILLNIGDVDGEVPLANIKFDNADEAVFVAKKLEENAPEGLKSGYHNIDKIVDRFKGEYKSEQAKLTETKAEVITEKVEPTVEPSAETVSKEDAEIRNVADKFEEKYNELGNTKEFEKWLMGEDGYGGFLAEGNNREVFNKIPEKWQEQMWEGDFTAVKKRYSKAVKQSIKEQPKTESTAQIFDRAFEAIKQRKKMAERDKILDEYGDKADKAKFVFKNWDKIKENLKQRAKEYEIEFKGDC